MEFCKKAISKFLFALCRSPMKEACAEFLGTFFLVVCGDGVLATITLGRLGQNATIVSAFGWGLSLAIGVSIAGAISGGHLNPAVTLALAVVRKCSWKNVVPFFVSQYLASFIAAAVVYLVYSDAISEFDNGFRQLPPALNSTAQIFSTYPQDFASVGSCFVDQVVGTSLFLIVICAATDVRNMALPPHMQPLVIGLGLTAIALAFGHNCGAPLNPARDLSPRIFTSLAGWGTQTFSFRSYLWFWIPIVGPHTGALLGVWLYDFLIDMPFRNYTLLLDEVESQERDEVDLLRRIAAASTSKPSLRPIADRSLSSEDYVGRTLIDGSSTPEENTNGNMSQRKSKTDSASNLLGSEMST